MAHYLRAQCALPNDGGLGEDVAMNVWHLRGDVVDIEDALDAADTMLNAIYQGIEGSLSQVLSGDLNITYYDLTDPEPRSPVRLSNFTFSPSAGAYFPNEVAMCLTLEGAAVSGIPVSRRRGRIFFGPLSQAMLDADEPDSRIGAADLTGIVGVLAGAIGDALGNDLTVQVLSRTIMGSPPWTEAELDAGTFTVVNISMDNAFDTVRSRGAAATIRERQSVT